jgi:hypothetical protein
LYFQSGTKTRDGQVSPRGQPTAALNYCRLPVTIFIWRERALTLVAASLSLLLLQVSGNLGPGKGDSGAAPTVKGCGTIAIFPPSVAADLKVPGYLADFIG